MLIILNNSFGKFYFNIPAHNGTSSDYSHSCRAYRQDRGRECLLNHVIRTFMNEIISTEGFLTYIRVILREIQVVLGKYSFVCYNK